MSPHTLVVVGGEVLLADGPRRVDLVAEGGGLVEVVEPGRHWRGVVVVDAGGCRVTPGFIDLQLNGAAGIDLSATPERVHEVGSALVRDGVTAYLPTIVSSGERARQAVLGGGICLTAPPQAAVALGWHFEGPLLNAQHRGVHDIAALRAPTLSAVEGWSAAAGVAMVTLAPELPGAAEVVRALRSRDVVVAAGHTAATAAEMDRATACGVSYVTHLFNAMRQFGHRDPGPIGAVLGGDHLVAGLIVDGAHVAPETVRMAWRCLGPRRLNLVSDASAAMGASGGHQLLGRRRLTVRDGAVRDADGRLAAGSVPLDAAVRNLVAITGCSWYDAVATVTTVPATLLADPTRGVVAPGARADLVVLDAGLRVRTTIVGGEVVRQDS